MTRTTIISDTHMPRHASIRSASALQGLIEGTDRLLVNGDLAEFHQPGLEEASRQVLEDLRERAERASTELLLLAGNHDPLISPWRAASFGEGRILVTHGDAFHSTIAPWAREARLIREEWKRIRDSHGRISETIEDRFDAVRGAALAEWATEQTQTSYSTIFNLMMRPRAALKILTYWRAAPSLARAFAEAFFPEAEFMIVGHTHLCGVNRAAHPAVINTGAFGFPLKPIAVILEGDRLEVTPLVRRKTQWLPAKDQPLLVEQVPCAGQLDGLFGPHPDEDPERGESPSSDPIDRTTSSTESIETPE